MAERGQRSLSQGKSDAMLLALIHFHCSPHSLSSHWYPIPNFCNSFIGSISTPFIHLNFNKLLHSVTVTKRFCYSIINGDGSSIDDSALKLDSWSCFYPMFVTWLLSLDAYHSKKDNRGSNVAKRPDNISGYSPRQPPSPPLSICKKFIQLNNYHKLYTKHPDVTIDNWEGSRRIII